MISSELTVSSSWTLAAFHASSTFTISYPLDATREVLKVTLTWWMPRAILCARKVSAVQDSVAKELLLLTMLFIVLVVTYDHHPATSDDIIADAQVVREWGSCSAILTHAIASYNQKVDAEAGGMDSSIPLVIMSPSTATSLALGIHHDTGNFTFASTSVEDMSATAYLRSGGINHDILRNYLPR